MSEYIDLAEQICIGGPCFCIVIYFLESQIAVSQKTIEFLYTLQSFQRLMYNLLLHPIILKYNMPDFISRVLLMIGISALVRSRSQISLVS